MGQKPDIIKKLEQDLGLEMQQTTSIEELWRQRYLTMT